MAGEHSSPLLADKERNGECSRTLLPSSPNGESTSLEREAFGTCSGNAHRTTNLCAQSHANAGDLYHSVTRRPRRNWSPPRGRWWVSQARPAPPWRERGSGGATRQAQFCAPGRLLVLFAETKRTTSQECTVARESNAMEQAAAPLTHQKNTCAFQHRCCVANLTPWRFPPAWRSQQDRSQPGRPASCG